MRVVSNTSPLLNLAIIDRLGLVQEQFGAIIIPPAVHNELKIDDERPGSSVLRDAVDTGWIGLGQVENITLCQALRRELDNGEAEAIALAVEVEADLILLDEREGRRVAQSMGLEVVGLVGILLKASHKGSIVSLRQELNLLREKAGFWLDDRLTEKVLALTDED
jgi:predicted nucleic acid-binding protein